MAHLTSFKANGAVGVLRHDERTENDEVHSRKNECIDITRTSLNYNLAPKRTGKLMEHIRQVCDDNNVRLNNRKDLNVMSSWVVTVPKTVPSQQYQLFFQRCYDFLKKGMEKNMYYLQRCIWMKQHLICTILSFLLGSIRKITD